jgi:hypothetical protein
VLVHSPHARKFFERNTPAVAHSLTPTTLRHEKQQREKKRR